MLIKPTVSFNPTTAPHYRWQNHLPQPRALEPNRGNTLMHQWVAGHTPLYVRPRHLEGRRRAPGVPPGQGHRRSDGVAEDWSLSASRLTHGLGALYHHDACRCLCFYDFPTSGP